MRSVIGSTFTCTGAIQSGSDRRRYVIERMRQEAIAERLGVSQPAISGLLARGGARDVARLTAAVRTLLTDGSRRSYGDGSARREVR